MESLEDFDLLLPSRIANEANDAFDSFDFNTPLLEPEIPNENDSLPGINLPSMSGAGFSPTYSSSAFSRLPVPTVLNIDSRKSSLDSSCSVSNSEVSSAIKAEPRQSKKQVKRKKINYTGMTSDEIALAKRTRRREQIAKASRLSRARRKQELTNLREENKKLKAERENHLKTIKQLSVNVESLRQTGDIDIMKENQMLRAQLEQHKTFLTCFKHLCDENQLPGVRYKPTESLLKEGANAAHEHVLSLLSQSVADNWLDIIINDDIDLPYEDFSASYKVATEFGFNKQDSLRQRLNIRLDIGYEGMEAEAVIEFLWSALSNSSAQKRLYNVKNLEVVQLESNTASFEKNTKLYYYCEKNKPPLKDNDWVVICNNKQRTIPSNLLEKKNIRKDSIRHVDVTVLSLSTTQHDGAPEVPNANRIKSFFLQGAAVYNDKANARISVVFSFPDDFETNLISGFDDIILPGNRIGPKFAQVIKELYCMMHEQEN